MKKYKILAGLVVALGTATSCLKNSDIDFPDFDYQTVYFANQYPVRTVVLGEDLIIDNSLDQQHKIEIKATLGGTRDNKKNVVIDFQVDASLLSNLYFSAGGTKIQPLPTTHYELVSNQIRIEPGNIMGGVQVQLTDAFFADPLAIQNNYAIPLKMTGVREADSILAHKDFVLYAVKFINPWHGNYLRRGVDVMTGDVNRTVTRRADYVERDEINRLNTKSFTEVEFPVQFRDDQNNIFSCTLLLSFDDAGNCSISSNSTGYTVTGSGAFISKGEKNSWGNRDRDGLYLDYQVTYNDVPVGSGDNNRTISGSIATKDTLVMRDRAVVPEYFTPVAN